MAIAPRFYIRLLQEDMWQALSEMPTRKYQSDGCPFINDLSHLLRDNTTSPKAGMREFLRIMALTVICLGTDAYARSFSLLIVPRPGHPEILFAPISDSNSFPP
jgi:serine/threonine-protein kinase HipA